MLLEIHGHHLPGRVWADDEPPRRNVHVGLQVAAEPVGLVAGDSASARWRTEIEVVARDAEPDFRGPAVQGRPGARFVYLTWGDVGADGTFTMFRRAKLMLADVAPFVAEDPSTPVVARVDLTDERGGPRCARLRPPALDVSRGA